MKQTGMRPVLIVNDNVFNLVKLDKTLLTNLYLDTVIKNNVIENETIELHLTMLHNKVSRQELEDIIYYSNIVNSVINKSSLISPRLKQHHNPILQKAKKIEQVYGAVTGKKRKNESILTEVKKNTMLDLKNRYSDLTKDDVLDLGGFLVCKVDNETLQVITSSSQGESMFNLLYGMYLNINGIASNIDFNKKIDKEFLGYMMPYIKTMHSPA